MPIPFLNHLDLRNVSELRNAILHKTTSASASNVEGKLIYDTGSDTIKYYNGSAWISLTGDTNTFRTVTAGGNTLGATETLAFTAGSNITITENAGAVTIAASDTNTNQLTTFVVEDGDGTEVTISQGKEWKFVEGGGIDINWTDTSDGSDTDPYDLSFTVSAGTSHIVDDAITTAKINDSAVTTAKINDAAVTTAKINDEAVTFAKMQHIATQRILGRNTSGTGDVEAITPTTFRPFLKSSLGGAFSSNALTIGNGSSTITIPGDLVVTGTTTTNNVETVSTSNGVVFEGNAADANEGTLLAGTLTADRTYTLPDATGTIALTSDLPTVGNGTITITAGNALTTGGTFTTNQSGNTTITLHHEDTSSQSSINNSGLNVIQDVTVDTYGHVTGLGSVDLTSGIDGRITAREFSGTIGNGSATTINLENSGASAPDIDHGLGTDSTQFLVQLIEVSSGATVYADVVRGSSGQVACTFATAPASDAIRVLITKIG